MKLHFRNHFWGYFTFYYRIVGKRLFVYLALAITVSFLDGMGLAMFMPLMQAVGDGNTDASSQSMGQLKYIVQLINNLGFDLTITVVLTVLVMLFVLKGILKYIQLKYQVGLRNFFMKKVRFFLVNSLQNLSYKGFLDLDGGKIQNTLTTEVQRLFTSMNFFFNAFQNAVMLGTYIFLAFLANYQFAILVALGAGLTNLIYRRIYVATQKASIELSQKGHDFNGFLVQSIHYFKYLKSTNYFKDYARKLKNVINETEGLNKKIGSYNAIMVSVKEPMIIIIVVLVILLQLNWFGSNLTSILLSLLLFYRALSFLASVQGHWQMFIENMGGMKSVSVITEEMSKMQENQGTTEFNTLQNQITFNNVEFAYGAKTVLNGASLRIPRNQTVALVGESGSGKTTVANMVAGLIVPDQGSMHIDNRKIQDYNIDSFRDKIGYISQESVIFNDNIYNNVTFWAEPTEENIARFRRTIRLASLTDFLESLPDKENTKLGDNGLLISGGQKQRISIARELYKHAEILIFDEATSALDSETERMIQENVEQLHGSYTIIIIAHRLSTIRNADIIYLLENGKVSASGTFEEMVSTSPRFKRMVSMQEF